MVVSLLVFRFNSRGVVPRDVGDSREVLLPATEVDAQRESASFARESSPASERRELGRAESAGEDAAKPAPALTRRLALRSACGVPLREPEVSYDEALWRSSRLRKGHLLMTDAEPAFVRAAGHLAQPVPEGATEVVLEPELGLIFHAPGLAAQLREVVIDASSSVTWKDRLGSHGPRGEDEYAFALSADFGHKVFADAIGLELRFHDHGALRLEPDWNARGTFRIDIAAWLPSAAYQPLRVATSCVHGGDSYDVTVTARSAERDVSRTRVATGVWGQLESLSEARAARVTGPCNRELDLGLVPVSHAQRIEARCQQGCRAQTTVFAADPDVPVLLELSSVPLVHGIALATSGARHPDRLFVEYALTDSPDPSSRMEAAWTGSTIEYLWVDEFSTLDAARNHVFLVRLIEPKPTDRVRLWTTPRFAHIRLQPVGFEPLERTIDLEDADARDMGTLYFEPIAPQLVITGGHQRISDYWLSDERLAIQLASDELVPTRAVRSGPNGEVLLFFEADAGVEAALAKWRGLPQASAVLGHGVYSAIALRRLDDHTLERVPGIRANCDISVFRAPPDRGFFYVGYRWNGMDRVWCKLGHDDVGSGFSLQFDAPDGPLDVWWSTAPTPPAAGIGGWGEFVDGRATIVIE